MAKVEKLFQKPKVKKLDILTEDINTFVEIFPDLDVTHSKNRIEIDLSDNMTLEPEFGEKPISRFVEEIYVYKGEDENNNKIFILEYLTTEGLFGYIDEPEVVEEEVDEMPIEAFVNTGVVIPAAAEVVKEKKVHIYDEILAMAASGKSRTQIFNELKEKHAKLNYRYVVQTLLKAKAAGVELNVPRQERVFAPKADAIANLEAKLAKMKAAITEEPVMAELEVAVVE